MRRFLFSRWICRIANDCHTKSRSGWMKAVSFPSTSIARHAVPTSFAALDWATRCSKQPAFYHDHFKWHCRIMVLMPDHLHGIIAFPREPGMKTTVNDWKKYLARNHGVEWQRDFFDHRLRNHHELDEKTSYALMNPVRKGLCERAEDWVWIYRPNDPPPTW